MFFLLRFRVKPGMTVGFGVVSITHPESVIIICLKDKNVNNPGYRPGNKVTCKLNPEVG